MELVLLTAYVLVWPIVVLGVLAVIVRGFVKELRLAKRRGRRII